MALVDNFAAEFAHHRELIAAMTEPHRPSDDAAWLDQQMEQLGAVREDLARLAADAKAVCPEPLRSGTLMRGRGPDLGLTTPPLDDPRRRALTLHVIREATSSKCRDIADQLGRLVLDLNRVADPGVLVFASQLERLAEHLRPPDAKPGPYAPRPR